jgi:S-adenosyl methyltransferase
VASHVTADYNDPASAADGVQAVQQAGVPFQLRTCDEFADLAFAGLELLPPGLVPVSEWRPDTEPGFLPRPAEVGYYGAVARKPIRPAATRISSCGQ